MQPLGLKVGLAPYRISQKVQLLLVVCLELLPHVGIKSCYEAKIEESEKSQQSLGIKPRTPDLCSQYSATELRQPDNHQPPPAPTILYMYCTSGCRSSVAEHWLHKPGVLGSIPSDCRPFHLPLFSPHNI